MVLLSKIEIVPFNRKIIVVKRPKKVQHEARALGKRGKMKLMCQDVETITQITLSKFIYIWEKCHQI